MRDYMGRVAWGLWVLSVGGTLLLLLIHRVTAAFTDYPDPAVIAVMFGLLLSLGIGLAAFVVEVWRSSDSVEDAPEKPLAPVFLSEDERTLSIRGRVTVTEELVGNGLVVPNPSRNVLSVLRGRLSGVAAREEWR